MECIWEDIPYSRKERLNIVKKSNFPDLNNRCSPLRSSALQSVLGKLMKQLFNVHGIAKDFNPRNRRREGAVGGTTCLARRLPVTHYSAEGGRAAARGHSQKRESVRGQSLTSAVAWFSSKAHSRGWGEDTSSNKRHWETEHLYEGRMNSDPLSRTKTKINFRCIADLKGRATVIKLSEETRETLFTFNKELGNSLEFGRDFSIGKR